MTISTLNRRLICIALLTILLPLSGRAVAGPPLLCHPIDIGNARSLPWGRDGTAKGSGYDIANLTRDTLAILDSESAIPVRMETLRRAAVYVDRKSSRADELLGRLMARILDAQSNSAKGDALAWFDAGYFVACLHQAGVKPSFGPAATKRGGAAAIPGYSWVAKAIELGGGAEMELAAALITVDHRVGEFDQHLRAALSAGETVQTPASNSVLQWIAQIKGTTLDDLRARYGLADARRER